MNRQGHRHGPEQEGPILSAAHLGGDKKLCKVLRVCIHIYIYRYIYIYIYIHFIHIHMYMYIWTMYVYTHTPVTLGPRLDVVGVKAQIEVLREMAEA